MGTRANVIVAYIDAISIIGLKFLIGKVGENKIEIADIISLRNLRFGLEEERW